MQRKKMLLLFFLCATVVAGAQDKYFTKTAKITFVSQAPLETNEAVNKTAGAILSTQSGTVQVVVLMRGFEFRKALMQEHFNENYVESDKYPKGEFKGTLEKNSTIDYSKEGTYTSTVQGELSLHGITKPLNAPVTITVEGGKIKVATTFNIQLSDYQIPIPAMVKDKVNNSVRVTFEARLDPLK